MKNKPVVVLSLYPNRRGFGYVCLEWPQKLIDSGIATVRPLCNSGIFDRFEKFLDFYKPQLIVIRDCENLSSCKKRTQKLIHSITIHAGKVKIPIHHYSREQIRDVFEQFGATTKYEIAQKIIEWFPELSWRAPKIRKPWKDEDYSMGIFDALALAITHKYLNE